MAKCNLIKISLRYLIIIWVCINGNKALAAPQINNLIIPISYFVNHKKQLKEIKEYLNKYRKVSIIGTSGIGKTQLARVYVQDNKDSYNIIWFFDCNLDLKEEFVKLAKHLNQVLKINIAEEANSAQQAVVNYLLSQNKWLLVFDNLKIGENKKLKELIDGKYNGDIIFCSQDRDGLSNILEMPLLDRENTVFLIKSLLDDKNDKDIEFLLKVFSGYPILIVQGAQLLNKIKGLNKEEYEEALEELNKAIKMLLVNTTDSKDLILSVRYLLKSKILNSLGKYQEAYAQLQQSYSVGTTREKENHAIYARIYTQFARSELGQGELSKALEHINLAIEILLADERRNPKDADYSEDADLAASYVTQGEIFFAKNNLKAAIDSYKKASIIYFYLYGKNLKNVAHVSYLYLQGAKAACKSKDLYNYKFFSNQQIQEFGVQHPNTIAILKYCKQYQINPG